MIFVNREKELEWLESLYKARVKGANYNVLIYGLRRVGKTALIMKFIEKAQGIYFNLAYVTDEKELIEALVDKGIISSYNKLEGLTALKSFFNFLDNYAKSLNRIVPIALDEFHILIENLAYKISSREKIRYKKAQEKIFWFLKGAIETSKNIFWIFSTSLSWHLIEKEREPGRKAFLALFSTKKIDPLDRESSLKLIRILLNKFNSNLSEEKIERIYELSGGIPSLIYVLVERIITSEKPLDETLIEIAKSKEITDLFEAILGFIADIIPYSKSSILRILKLIAKGYESPSQIAEIEGISYNSAYNILETLYEADLLRKEKLEKETRYFLKYPLMKSWLLSISVIPETTEKKLRYSLGIAFESYIRELFHEMKKLKAPLTIKDSRGNLSAGTWKEISFLPIAEIFVPKGKEIEQVDAIAIGRLGELEESYIIEAKYTYSPITQDIIEKHANRCEFLVEKHNLKNPVPIVIQGGEGEIKPQAAVLAVKKGIKIITRAGIEVLAKRLGLPPP